jgi:hypothetical protein
MGVGEKVQRWDSCNSGCGTKFVDSDWEGRDESMKCCPDRHHRVQPLFNVQPGRQRVDNATMRQRVNPTLADKTGPGRGSKFSHAKGARTLKAYPQEGTTSHRLY